jgi:hypothetical protein
MIRCNLCGEWTRNWGHNGGHRHKYCNIEHAKLHTGILRHGIPFGLLKYVGNYKETREAFELPYEEVMSWGWH